MRKSAVIIVIVIIALVVLLSLQFGKPQSIIQDSLKTEEQIQLNIKMTTSDEPNLEDLVDTNQTKYDHYIDEQDSKHYIINAIDTPVIEN